MGALLRAQILGGLAKAVFFYLFAQERGHSRGTWCGCCQMLVTGLLVAGWAIGAAQQQPGEKQQQAPRGPATERGLDFPSGEEEN